MKHLICILAHKNIAHLELLITECTSRGYEVLIHLDKKNRAKILSQSALIEAHTIGKSINVTRAHITIVEASLLLLEAANKRDYDYLHLISGEDFIVKSAAEFETFFSENKGQNFINHNTLPIRDTDILDRENIFSKYTEFKDRINTENYASWYFENGLGLLSSYYFRPGSVADRIVRILTPSFRFRKLYKKLARRVPPQKQYYAGSAWFSITKDMAAYLVEETRNSPEFYHFFKNSLFPDEIYFHTLAMNSTLANTVINSDLRYIPWDSPVNFGPRHITASELTQIKKSNGFFARKFDLGTDTELKKQLYKTLYDTH